MSGHEDFVGGEQQSTQPFENEMVLTPAEGKSWWQIDRALVVGLVAATAAVGAVGVTTLRSASSEGLAVGTGGGGNTDCPDGTDLVAKFEAPTGGSKTDGPVTAYVDDENVLWESTVDIDAVISKGATGSYVQLLPSDNDFGGIYTNEVLPLNNGGQRPAFSNVKFCAGDDTPETSAPETSAPETSAPETSAPETSAPETSAPETSAPETSAPETTAPETTAPATTTSTTSTTTTTTTTTTNPPTSTTSTTIGGPGTR